MAHDLREAASGVFPDHARSRIQRRFSGFVVRVASLHPDCGSVGSFSAQMMKHLIRMALNFRRCIVHRPLPDNDSGQRGPKAVRGSRVGGKLKSHEERS